MKKIMLLFLVSLVILLSSCGNSDTTAPVITVSSYTQTQQLGGMIQTPTATCTDDVDATCFVQTDYDPNWVDDLGPGTYTFTFTAEDNAGNVTVVTADLTLTN